MPLSRSAALRVISKPELNHQKPTMTIVLATNTAYATSGVDQAERAGGRRRTDSFSKEVSSCLTLSQSGCLPFIGNRLGRRGRPSPIRLQSRVPNIEAGFTH